MDRLTAFVCVAHLKLRLDLYCNHPELFREVTGMGKSPLYIPRPVELAGMRSRLLRARQQEKDVGKLGEDYDAVMDGIDEAKDAIAGHVGDLRGVESELRSTIMGMLERTNGAPIDGDSDGRRSSSGTAATDAAAASTSPLPVPSPLSGENGEGDEQQAPPTATAPIGQAAPEELTINGVSKGA